MIYPGMPVPDLLPLEPPEAQEYRERDEDELYQEWRDEHETL